MLVCLLVIRLFDTFFELPSSALLAELTDKYDERTSLIAIRQLCGVIGGLIMTLLVYEVFLKEHPDGSGGITQREGWFEYSIVAAITIFTIILISSRGTHHQIPYLRKPPARKIPISRSSPFKRRTANRWRTLRPSISFWRRARGRVNCRAWKPTAIWCGTTVTPWCRRCFRRRCWLSARALLALSSPASSAHSAPK